MLKKKEKSNRLFNKKGKRYSIRRQRDDPKDIIFYKYKKPGHIKVDCRKIEKRWTSSKNKKKNLLVTLDDLDNEDSSDSSNEETINIYLMTKENQLCDEVIVKTYDSHTSSESDSDLESKAEDMSYDNILLQQSYLIA